MPFHTFTIYGEPLGKELPIQSASTGLPVMATKTRGWVDSAVDQMLRQLPAGWRTLTADDGVMVIIDAYHTRPKSRTCTHRPLCATRGASVDDIEAATGEALKRLARRCDIDNDAPLPKPTTPDWDNLAKTDNDAVTHAQLWTDDCIPYIGHVRKRWAPAGQEPYTLLTLAWGDTLDHLPWPGDYLAADF